MSPRRWTPVALLVTSTALFAVWSTNEAMRQAERELALQAQRADDRTVKDWQQKKGASATQGRASRGSSKEQVARQTSGPKSAL
jgi:hypothetical protein